MPLPEAEGGEARKIPTKRGLAKAVIEEAKQLLACATLRAELGLLGELAAEPCLFELFHNTPGPAELRGCVRKQLH